MRRAFFEPRSISISRASEDRALKLGQEQKIERAPPMLAKRFIVAAFAALAVGMSSLAFSGSNDLFVDMQPQPTVVAILD